LRRESFRRTVSGVYCTPPGGAGDRARKKAVLMAELSEKKLENAPPGSLQAVAEFVRRHLRRPFSFYLISLLLIAIIPPFIFSSVILQRNLDAQREVVN
jgi:hypothetical protein